MIQILEITFCDTSVVFLLRIVFVHASKQSITLQASDSVRWHRSNNVLTYAKHSNCLSFLIIFFHRIKSNVIRTAIAWFSTKFEFSAIWKCHRFTFLSFLICFKKILLYRHFTENLHYPLIQWYSLFLSKSILIPLFSKCNICFI